MVRERLKYVDELVRARKIDEAFKEITEIRKLDSRNPYAYAYEERIRTLKQQTETNLPPPTPASQPSPQASAGPVPTHQPGLINARKEPAAKSTPSIPSSPPAPVQSPSDVTHGQSLKGLILLVDDDELLAKSVCDLLRDEGYMTKFFLKGEDALEYLNTDAPDLVICDVNLETSKFGGFTLHTKMRELEHLRRVPFIFLSGLQDKAIVLAGKEVGADDYLTKPVEPDALLSVVKGKLKRYKQIKKGF